MLHFPILFEIAAMFKKYFEKRKLKDEVVTEFERIMPDEIRRLLVSAERLDEETINNLAYMVWRNRTYEQMATCKNLGVSIEKYTEWVNEHALKYWSRTW
jgi:hypothetical protein